MIGRTLAHYELVERLGEGGMGVVYKARDTHLDRFVAIKVLPPGHVADPERRRRFVREAKAASALDHPNIVHIYDIDRDQGADFIAMEYIPGKTLTEIIPRGGMPLDQVLKCAAQIADALATAHAAGIVHRDLKPSNVMVGDDARVRLLDFGLAKLTEPAPPTEEGETATDNPRTERGLVLGTVGYMSPEQAQGWSIDSRSDTFSFGSLLYEMVTGQRAFRGPSTLSVLTAIVRDDPPPLRTIAPEAPAELEQIVSRCLRKDPAERWQRAGELKRALEEVRLGRPAVVPSIAVLPFTNLSADKENEYFSDGLAEELINALAHLPGLRVTARSSAFHFKGKELDAREIGARLNVDHILEGSVRRSGDRIRVTAQLIQAAGGYHLWSERFDREMTDVFAVQDEIAGAVVNELRVKLTDDRPRVRCRTEDMEAYDLYLKGRHQFYRVTGESVSRGKHYFEETIKRAPEYAPAYTGLVAVYNVMAMNGDVAPREALPKMRAAALRALELDEALGEPHAALGLVHAELEYNWRQAEYEFRLALDRETSSGFSHHWYALFVLAPMLRLDEAVTEMHRALETDPVSPFYHAWRSLMLCWQGGHDKAIEQLQRTLELDPYYHATYTILGVAYMAKGMFDQAATALERAVELSGRSTYALGFLGAAYGAAGRDGEARRLLAELLDLARHAHTPAIAVAHVCMGLGDIDQAFQWLDKAVEEREPRMLWLKPSQLYEPYRSDPRYLALLRKMNLE